MNEDTTITVVEHDFVDLMMFEGLPAPGGEPCPAAPWSMYAAREDVNVTVAGNNADRTRSEVSRSVSGFLVFGVVDDIDM